MVMASSLSLHEIALLVFLSSATTAFIFSNGENKVHCIERERQALVTFKESLKAPNDSAFSSWVDDYCCNWTGITCSRRTGHVIQLDLQSSGIDMPSSGQINPSLLQLRHLQYLILTDNNFGYKPIPEFFGSFKKLRVLQLSNACFGGQVPHHLGNLSMLLELDLSNDFYPPTWTNDLSVNNFNWLSHLSSLQTLAMGSVNLSRAGNWLQEINDGFPSLSILSLSDCSLGKLPPLIHHPNISSLAGFLFLDLSYNGFQGPLPNWLSNFQNLYTLFAFDNHFEGRIPSYFGNFSNLRFLDLSMNNFRGQIPSALYNLPKLFFLDMSGNHLEGQIPSLSGNISNLWKLDLSANDLRGQIPSTFENHKKLSYLNMSYNSFEGSLPDWLINFQKLVFFDMSHNYLEGELPPWIGNFPDLNYLILSDNNLRGQLPLSFKNFSELEYLDLSKNNLIGHLPLSFGNSSKLRVLDLSRNNMRGLVPYSFEKFSALQILDLSRNNLGGQIPSSLRNLSNLRILDLSKNNLSGKIPSLFDNPLLQWLLLSENDLSGEFPSFNLSSLIGLDLSKNKLSGSIPAWIWERISGLKFLSLRSNMLYGNIPSQLALLPSLQVLDLASNHLTGTIPTSFNNFIAMKMIHSLNATDERVVIVVVIKGIELEYTKIISLLTSIDLSNNNLSGEIPTEVTNLHGLKSLNLSGNKLEGRIPDNIGSLVELESLDFSRNHLSGSIPESISSLSFLSSLNLSFNHLSGPIPHGYQLQTLTDPSIYMGNYNLCGLPLSEMCPDHVRQMPLTPNDGDEEDESKLRWFFVGFAPGFVVGFWAIFGAVLINGRCRFAFFRLVDRLNDSLNGLYVFAIVKIIKINK